MGFQHARANEDQTRMGKQPAEAQQDEKKGGYAEKIKKALGCCLEREILSTIYNVHIQGFCTLMQLSVLVITIRYTKCSRAGCQQNVVENGGLSGGEEEVCVFLLSLYKFTLFYIIIISGKITNKKKKPTQERYIWMTLKINYVVIKIAIQLQG